MSSYSNYSMIGSCLTDVGTIVGAKNQTVILDLRNQKHKTAGKIVLRCETIANCNEEVTMQW